MIEDQGLFKRFWSKVNKTEGCWNWTASKNKRGYGYFAMPKNKHIRAHRLSWMMANGEIPNGLFVCHKCDNPPCCNPSHLFLGTSQDNINDRNRKDRQARPSGESNPFSKLTRKEVEEIRSLYPSMTHAAIAKKYNVSRSTIGLIILKKSWVSRKATVEDKSK